MQIKLFKTLDLFPIGDIAFVWNKKTRTKGTRILISEISILTETRLSITAETEKILLKEMKFIGSDLLTDGTKFYTTFGEAIQEIKHPQFIKELEIYNELK